MSNGAGGFAWWASGVPDTDGDSYVEVDSEGGRVVLTAGQHDHEVWGRVWLSPEVALQVAAALLAAAESARGGAIGTGMREASRIAAARLDEQRRYYDAWMAEETGGIDGMIPMNTHDRLCPCSTNPDPLPFCECDIIGNVREQIAQEIETGIPALLLDLEKGRASELANAAAIARGMARTESTPPLDKP